VSEITLSEDGTRALREAENLCWKTNVDILAPEHLLAGALLVLAGGGWAQLPGDDELMAGVTAIHASGSEALTDNVMWGSSARQALNAVAGAVQAAAGTVIDARVIAAGLMDSGEVHPMFYGAIGTSKAALFQALASA
jgi:hypothetical protein